MSLPSLASWRNALEVYRKPQAIAMLFLGFSAGLPLLLIFSSLSLWLREAGVERGAVTYFSWAALAYSFKFVWAPLIDKLPLPGLYTLLGRRRSWLLVAQLLIMTSIILMGMTDPIDNLPMMALATVLLGLSAASQDIVIDAYRIESAGDRLQAALAAMYIAGYRVGMLASGAGALYLATWFGSDETYSYAAWRLTYLCMAMLMLVGVITTLVIKEPVPNQQREAYLHSSFDYLRFVLLFMIVTAVFILAFLQLGVAEMVKSSLREGLGFNGVLAAFFGQTVQIAVSITLAALTARGLILVHAVNRDMVRSTYVDPVVDFFRRYAKLALWILLLVGFYRISDIVLGVISNVFYFDMGYTKEQIASINKVLGLIMALLGGFVGGLLTTRFGIMRMLLTGAILAAATNLLFMWLATMEPNVPMLALVIAADNLCAGLASAAFIAYLSSLTSISFTAVQYAIFSSLMTLFPKVLGGYSGGMVESLGYPGFFLLTALLGVPVIGLILYLMRREATRVSG
ncbi:AmpG family muropeptide MFS transporter [Thiohalophilus sp.]|uniref:AmpG family muropeptide MFS transporter n=1 Tax=Thiohalophilus sp. TaxID=3028392 RepID=UPI002ACEC54B|nr:MFS transporter [Thiohalophilus sp.]MDZ7661800.1 MFS transporter [Thiohalophilus sp.]